MPSVQNETDRKQPALPLFEPHDPFEAKFLEFHRANPHVYDALKSLCLQVRRAGVQRFGIRTVWERLRWQQRFETLHGRSDYKLNDHYTRHYARLLMRQEPELAGLFEVRGSQ